MLGRAIQNLIQATPNATQHAARGWTRMRRAVLVLAGFASIDYAVFQLADQWGWIAVGVSLLVYEALDESSTDNPTPDA